MELTISRKGGAPQTVNVTPLVPKGGEKAIIGILPDFEVDGIGWMEGGRVSPDYEKPF